jgi:hypothetical protein
MRVVSGAEAIILPVATYGRDRVQAAKTRMQPAVPYRLPGPRHGQPRAYLFAALSHACHYHPYELAPTAAELTGWLDQAAQIVTKLRTGTAAPATQT